VYLDSGQVSQGAVLEGFDICIAGAGAAGLPMAKRLIGSGKSVLLLAAGLPDERGLPPGFRQKIYKGRAGELLSKVDPYFLQRSRLHMFSGTTNHFGFWARPLDEVDFEVRSGHRNASWPLSLAGA
jgi:choline dehydrogenase-like flavoprotein